MERLASATQNVFLAHGAAKLESGMATREQSLFGRSDRGFEDTKGHADKEFFKSFAEVLGRDKIKEQNRQARFLVLGNPLGRPEDDHSTKALSADSVVSLVLSLAGIIVFLLAYAIFKPDDLLFGPLSITAFFAAVGASTIFWIFIAVVFALVLARFLKNL